MTVDNRSVKVMPYPRLPEDKDKRKKLMARDIAAIRKAYAALAPFPTKSEVLKSRHTEHPLLSEPRWMEDMATLYGVGTFAIYYHIKDEYRAHKMRLNAKAHSKANMEDYIRHRAASQVQRIDGWKRHPPIRKWHYQTGARNEKRAKRTKVMGEQVR